MTVVHHISALLTSAHPRAPHIDYAAIAPFEALLGGAVVVLLVGLLRSRFVRYTIVPALTLLVLAGGLAVTIWQWNDHLAVVSGALRIDDLTLVLTMLFVAAGAATVILSWRARAPQESAHGEYHALLLSAIPEKLVEPVAP